MHPLPFHSHQRVQAQQQAEICEAISRQGFAVRNVFSSHSAPPWSYTVGLYDAEAARPELLISSPSIAMCVEWLRHLGFLMKGPPPSASSKQIAAGIYPQGGRRFEPGVLYRDLADDDLPTCFGLVEPQYYEAYVGQAIVFHQTTAFPLLQVVWPDERRHFPWEPRFARKYKRAQHLLFDPETYLPLREASPEA